MKDSECVRFLQWALPRLRMRWRGFRKVRHQVCKRIHRRMQQLELHDSDAYRAYLQQQPQEWELLDSFCRITISRFNRDRAVFEQLQTRVLPELAARAVADRQEALRAWSVGCASGEEVYTLRVVYDLHVREAFGGLPLRILATDADPHMLERAERGAYGRSSLREVPPEWLSAAMEPWQDGYRVRAAQRGDIVFCCQDVREEMPKGLFDLVLCRNLVFTYFDTPLQRQILRGMGGRIVPGGFLVIGSHESLPEGTLGFAMCEPQLGIWRRSEQTL